MERCNAQSTVRYDAAVAFVVKSTKMEHNTVRINPAMWIYSINLFQQYGNKSNRTLPLKFSTEPTKHSTKLGYLLTHDINNNIPTGSSAVLGSVLF